MMARRHRGLRVGLYLRVSSGEQTTENQRRELQALAEHYGWNIVEVFEDAGISGAMGRDKRPALDRMLKMVTRGQIDLIAAWSVDRLGRSLQDLISILNDLHAKGVDLYLHQQGVDTTTPSGKAMFQMMGVFAEFERAMIRERVLAGIARAREQGTKSGKPIGRARTLPKVEAAIQRTLAKGLGVIKTAKQHGVGVGTVQRIKAAMTR